MWARIASAQDSLSVTRDSVRALQEIVVTVSRAEESTASLTAAADVVRREEMAAAMAVTPDQALRTLAGVSVVGDAGFGQEVRLNLRGLNSGFGTQRTLVLLDGRPLTDEYLGHVDLAQYPLASVDRMELVRGPSSAAYGSSAMGGVLNLLPMRAGPQPRAEAAVQGGTFGSVDPSAYYSRRFGSADALVSVAGQSTDGYLKNSRGLPMDWDGRTAVVNAGYTGSRSRARTYGHFFHGRGTDEDYRRTFTRYSQDLDLATDLGGSHRATADLRLWYSHLSQDYDWFEQPASAWRQHTIGAIGSQTYTAGPLLSLVSGIEARRQTALVEDASGTVDRSTTLWALFVQDRLTIGDRTTVLLGLRGDGRPSGGVEPSFRAGVNVRLDDRTTVLGAFGRAFRVPTISDRYLPRTSFFGLEFEGNPDLDPETALSGELGLRRSVGHSVLLGVTGFATDARDFWDFIPDTDGVFRPRNIARVRIRGLEAEARAWVDDRLEIRASYTFTDARYRSFEGNEDAEGNRLDDNVRNAGAFAITWMHPAGHSLRFATRALGNRVTDPLDPPGSRLPGFAVLDASGALAVTEAVRLSLGVFNLGDRSYRLRPEFPQPGRSVVAGVRFLWNAPRAPR